MNPLKYAQMMKYLTRAKKTNPDLPDVFPASKAPIPAKTQTVQEMEAINEFVKRNPQADGGRIGFKDGPRKIYKVARPITEIDRKQNPNIPEDAKFKMQVPGGKFRGKGSSTEMIYDTNKTNLNKRLKEIESNVYVKPSTPKEPIPDDKFLVKKNSTRIKENINKIEYEEVLGKKNQPNTFKSTGKTIIRYKPFIGQDKITIPGQGANTLKEAETFVKDYFKANPKKVRVRDPEKDYRQKDIRRQFEKDLQGRTIKFGAPKGYTAHHMLPLAGKADVTDSDIAIISNKMNAELAQFDKPMNALVNEAYALDFSKEGSLKRMDEINKELADIVKKSENKLPKKYKGLIGFNKLTPVLEEFDSKGNQVFDMERIGADYKKSIGGKKIGTPLRDKKTKDIVNQVIRAPKFKATIPVIENIMNVAKSIPGDVAKKSYFKAVGKAAGLAFTPIMLYDTYKALEQGKPLLESLEQGLIGTDLIGGTKRIVSLTPEERTARSVVKQDALKDLNLDMPMGFGFIEGPTPDSNLTLEQAKAKMDAGEQRVKDLQAQKNFDRATNRANFFGNMKDRILGAPQQLQFNSGGIASGPPPKRGPLPQGLPGLLKRGMKI